MSADCTEHPVGRSTRCGTPSGHQREQANYPPFGAGRDARKPNPPSLPPPEDLQHPWLVIIGIVGAIVAEVCEVRLHPRGTFIWLADVDMGDGCPVQIVFGGERKLHGGELVAVAPPGSRAIVRQPDDGIRRKKMRARNYRGQRSHGMLCSLDELGWISRGPNEVAVLCGLPPGTSLDDLPEHRRPEVVVDWERAQLLEKGSDDVDRHG